MIIGNLSEEETEIPAAILDLLSSIKNEQACENSITSMPAYQRTRTNFIKSVRKTRESTINTGQTFRPAQNLT